MTEVPQGKQSYPLRSQARKRPAKEQAEIWSCSH